MSRKHYRMIAEAFKDASPKVVDDHETALQYAALKQTARDIAYVMKVDNSNFRLDTFMDACFGHISFENGYCS